jgi:hypothetical protein
MRGGEGHRRIFVRIVQGGAGTRQFDVVGQTAREIFRPAQHVAQARRHQRQRAVAHQVGLGLHLAGHVALGRAARIVPRVIRVDRLCFDPERVFGQRAALALAVEAEHAVGVDGRGHDVAPDLAGKGTHGDRRIERAVAHLVVDDVEGTGLGDGAHGEFVAAVGADALDAVAEGIGRIAAGGDGDAVAGAQEPLHEQPADETGTADHQDVLGHWFSLR